MGAEGVGGNQIMVLEFKMLNTSPSNSLDMEDLEQTDHSDYGYKTEVPFFSISTPSMPALTAPLPLSIPSPTPLSVPLLRLTCTPMGL